MHQVLRAAAPKSKNVTFHFILSSRPLPSFWAVDYHLKAKFQNFEFLNLYCNNCSSLVGLGSE